MHQHISFYSLLCNLLLLLVSWTDGRTTDTCATVASHLLLVQLFTIVVVVLARECRRSLAAWFVWTIKVTLLLATLAHFRGRLSYRSRHMTTSIVILGLYCTYVDINRVYECQIEPQTLHLSLVGAALCHATLASLV